MLQLDFIINPEQMTGTDNYAILTRTYADGPNKGQVDQIRIDQADWSDYSNNRKAASYTKIAAKEMGDEINVQILTVDGAAVGGVYTDSVKAYAVRQLRKATEAKIRTLYVDMLNYGAAAQTYFKYDAANLVTDELTETEKGYGTKEVKLENNLVKGPGYGASQLNLASSIQLRVKFNGIDSSMYAIVKFTNHNGREIEERIEGSEFMYSGTVVVIDQVVAADYDRDVTITVYDADGNDVKQGEVGELAVYGPGVMKCYYNDEKSTEEVLADGWLRTGDMAMEDEDGFIFLVDRKKDVVISGGENIYPVQIENFLSAHSKIKDVAVIGLPDSRLGEISTAIIELKQDESCTEEEIKEYLTEEQE